MNNYPAYKQIGFFLGPTLFLVILFLPPTFFDPAIQKVVAVAAWMVTWWITEAVYISITALLPLALFPLLGTLTIDQVANSYGSPIVFLFFGGFIIALAIEKVNLHRRIALNIVRLTGTNANGIVLGFMIATGLMSMWISNTASTVVMLPIALSVVKLLIDDADGFTKKDQNFALSIMLGIAFSANIGGTATLIGTPPNSVMLGILQTQFDLDISFFKWMLMAVPFAVIMLVVAYFFIVHFIYPNHLGKIKGSEKIIDGEIKKLGPMTRGEIIVTTIFSLTALSWILRSWLNDWFPNINLNDTIISMIGAIAMLIAPLHFKKGAFVLSWSDTQKLPWGILLLFGGGLALAAAMKEVRIIEMVGTAISQNPNLSILGITIVLTIVMLFMTELMSNVALATIFIPVVGAIAIGLEVPILNLVIPVTIASSCAFMLPMATPPNAIVFASGYVKVYEMVKVGVFLNVVAVLLLVIWAYTLIPFIF